MTVRPALGRPAALALTALRVPNLSPGAWIALAAFVGYLALGAWLAFVARDIDPDTWSRAGNAYYVLFSRDPHLGAIGFVWGPLPSVLIMPLLPFAAIFPALVTHAFAAYLLSAAFMAGSVYVLWMIVRDLQVARLPALAIVVLFAINPETVFFGANGMSEAIFIFFLLTGTWALIRWLELGNVLHLVVLGSSLAAAYLTRYEAVAAAGAALAVVVAVSAVRARGSLKDRALRATADALIMGVPFAAAFLAFAFASWVVSGHPFETFASTYGNASQVEVMREILRDRTGFGTAAAGPFVRDQVLGLQPGFLLVLGIATIAAFWRRDPRILAPLALMGGVLLFAVVAFLSERTFGSLRFYISVIPLVAVLAALALARSPLRRGPNGVTELRERIAAFGRRSSIRAPGWRPRDREGVEGAELTTDAPRRPRLGGLAPRESRLVAGLVAAVLLLSMAVSVPSAYATRMDPQLGEGRAQQGLMHLRRAEISEDVARWLDAQDLPRGSVLIDVATGFRVVLQSRHPTQFVITPDRDFDAAVANPALNDVRYLVVPTNMVLDQLDALNQAYPELYENGAGLGELVFEASRPDEAWRYRIYEVHPVD